MPAVTVDRIVSAIEWTGAGQYIGTARSLAGALGLVDAAADKTSRSQLQLGLGAAAGAAGLIAGIGKTVAAAGKLEQVRIGFESALGSAGAAQAKLKELQEFDARSPFNFEETARAAQTLLGLGASAEQVIPIMSALGNAVSASGRGTAEFGRAALAVGQIISKGKLQGDELLQLAEAGVPLTDMLKELGVSYGEVGKKGITAQQAIAALTKVLSQGRFAGAMERQNRSLTGSFDTLKGSAFQFAAAMGTPLLRPRTPGRTA
jgi:tape measure domain-containing protein